MLLHKGTPTLETDRLILRRFTLDDAGDMFNNWAGDPEVTRYLSWLPHENVEASREIVAKWVDSYGNPEVYNWAIVPKDYGKVIGSISIIEVSERNQHCEIGYCLGKTYWNRGIMTEALKAVIGYAIREIGLARVQAIHHTDNPASGKVMRKAGMKYEGRLRRYHMSNRGVLADCDMYAILEEDLKSGFEDD